jgi:hypothetical protein
VRALRKASGRAAQTDAAAQIPWTSLSEADKALQDFFLGSSSGHAIDESTDFQQDEEFSDTPHYRTSTPPPSSLYPDYPEVSDEMPPILHRPNAYHPTIAAPRPSIPPQERDSLLRLLAKGTPPPLSATDSSPSPRLRTADERRQTNGGVARIGPLLDDKERARKQADLLRGLESIAFSRSASSSRGPSPMLETRQAATPSASGSYSTHNDVSAEDARKSLLALLEGGGGGNNQSSFPDQFSDRQLESSSSQAAPPSSTAGKQKDDLLSILSSGVPANTKPAALAQAPATYPFQPPPVPLPSYPLRPPAPSASYPLPPPAPSASYPLPPPAPSASYHVPPPAPSANYPLPPPWAQPQHLFPAGQPNFQHTLPPHPPHTQMPYHQPPFAQYPFFPPSMPPSMPHLHMPHQPLYADPARPNYPTGSPQTRPMVGLGWAT